MKNKGLQFLISTAAALLLCSYILYETEPVKPASPADEHAKDQVLMKVLIQSLQASHYEPKVINDQFSKDAFELYLERLDFSKRFLIQDDVDRLRVYEKKIDDQVNEGGFTLFDESWDILQSRLEKAQSYYREILQEPFDFESDEKLALNAEDRDFAKNEEALKDHWRKILKYQTLTRIIDMERDQERAMESSDTVKAMTFEEMEAKARQKVLKSNDRFFERMEKWEKQDQMEVYINAMMNVYGPHTGYFAPKKKENFDISMSGQLEGIGAQLQEKDGFIKVTRIVPGSASYRQGDLEEEDVILKVAQGKEEPVDITNMRLDDAVKLIRGKKGTEVRLTVRKINGAIKEISIIRDVVILEETYAKSAIVENESGKRVGYIKLPKFYADFNKKGGRAAADDVRQEIEKLKEEGIDGIVLDLRGNGGGSLRDAIEMTGHFISTGPVVQVKGRYSAAEVLSDRNPNVLYDGPLVVMLNHFSASASEILAAAIQDYDRGIIMGSSGSFGKGTVQRFVNLDRMLTSTQSDLRPLGSVKVTTQKFYRINGGATQLRGVESDIEMPDRFNLLEMGEREQDFVMPWDEISPAKFKMWEPPYNEKAVIEASQERIKRNPVMQLIDENAIRLKEQSDEKYVSLNYKEYKAREQHLDEQEEMFDDILKPIESLHIHNIGVDLKTLGEDSIKLELNEKWLKKLNKDIYLNEAVHVIADMAA